MVYSLECSKNQKCKLYDNLLNPGISLTGNISNPEILFVGECPGYDEDMQGACFVGDSGKLLRSIISDMDFDADKIAYGYVVRCRCTDYKGNDRSPKITEIKNCKHNIEEDIKRLKPKVVVLLGNGGLQLIDQSGITNNRGRVYEIDGMTYIPTYSPGFILRDNTKSGLFIDDLNKVKGILEGTILKKVETNYIFLNTIPLFLDFFEYITTKKYCAFDLETSGLSLYGEDLFTTCVSFSAKIGESFCIPLRHNLEQFFNQKQLANIFRLLKILFEDCGIGWIAQNGRFDVGWLNKIDNITVKDFIFDTMLFQYLISVERGTHDLGYIATRYTDLGNYWLPLEEYKEKNKINCYANIPWEILWPYNAADSDCTFRAFTYFVEKFRKAKY